MTKRPAAAEALITCPGEMCINRYCGSGCTRRTQLMAPGGTAAGGPGAPVSAGRSESGKPGWAEEIRMAAYFEKKEIGTF